MNQSLLFLQRAKNHFKQKCSDIWRRHEATGYLRRDNLRLTINCSHNKAAVVVNQKKGWNSTGLAFRAALSLLFLILDTAGAALWWFLLMKTNKRSPFMPSFLRWGLGINLSEVFPTLARFGTSNDSTLQGGRVRGRVPLTATSSKISKQWV